MNDSRSRIMGRLKTALDKIHNPTVRLSGADQRIREPLAPLVPKRGQSEGIARVEMFINEAERVNTQVIRLDSIQAVPAAIQTVCADVAASGVKIAPHPTLQALDWTGQDVTFGIGHGDDAVGLSFAYGGVAETGTLVMRASAISPTTLNFLPDTHVVVILADSIEANYEAVWDRLRGDADETGPVLGRTINWITGPSRTADIEQTILLGAHGPRKLVILLVDETA